MSVIPLTLTISLCLVFTFVVFFLREHNRQRFSSAESDALLPLADELPRLATQPKSRAKGHHHHEHSDGKACGCKTGERPPVLGLPAQQGRIGRNIRLNSGGCFIFEP